MAGHDASGIVVGRDGTGGDRVRSHGLRRLRAQNAYRPEFEDWLFHTLLPFAAYAVLGAAGVAPVTRLREALFGVAGAVLLLLFIGIHNAWDAVTYHVFVQRRRLRE